MKIEIEAELMTSTVDLPATRAGTKFPVFRGMLVGLSPEQDAPPSPAPAARTEEAAPEVIAKMSNLPPIPRKRLDDAAVSAIKGEILRVLRKYPSGLTSLYAGDALGIPRRDDRARVDVMNIARSMVADGILEQDKTQSKRYPVYRVRGLVKQGGCWRMLEDV